MKKTLVYVDHSFHKITGSGDFLRDIFKKEYKIVDLWDDQWKGGSGVTAERINKYKPDMVFFFQSILSIDEIKMIDYPVVWAPMYDSVISAPDLFWKELATTKVKIVCFCHKLFEKISDDNKNCIYVKHFKNPKDYKIIDTSGKRIFFWQRTGFSFNDLKILIGNQKIDEVVLKIDSDPGHKTVLPSRKDINKYKIKVLEKSYDKKEYLKNVGKCNIFVSPRLYEGIGMSFLEAMAMGMEVVAMDNPTMNEYIKNGVNGRLFSPYFPTKIDFCDIKKISKKCLDDNKSGYDSWQKDGQKILGFMKKGNKNKMTSLSGVEKLYLTASFKIKIFFYYLKMIMIISLSKAYKNARLVFFLS